MLKHRQQRAEKFGEEWMLIEKCFLGELRGELIHLQSLPPIEQPRTCTSLMKK